MALTRRQREVLEVIRSFLAAHGYSPSLQEIGKELGLSSAATVHKHVSHLVAKGFVKRGWNQNRSIELVGGSDAGDAVPVRGTVRADTAPRLVDTTETVRFPGAGEGAAGSLFALRVEGLGFEDVQVREGDILVLEGGREPREGETVLAVLDGPASKVVRWTEGGDEREPGARGDVAVAGVLVGLVRRYGLS